MSETNQMNSSPVESNASTPTSVATAPTTTSTTSNTSTDGSRMATDTEMDDFMSGFDVDYKPATGTEINDTNEPSTNTTGNENNSGEDSSTDVPEENGEDQENSDNASKPEDEPDVPDFLEIVYNKKSEKLTKKQAIELAQKGKNYDRKVQQLTDAQNQVTQLQNALNSPLIQTISRIAKDRGMNAQQFAEYLSNFDNQYKVNSKVNELKAKYPTATPQMLQDMAAQQLQLENQQMMNNQQLAARQKQEAVQKRNEELIKEFADKFPDVSGDDITDDVLEDIKHGYTPVQAWEKHIAQSKTSEIADLQKQLSDLKKQLDAEKKNNQVASKSTGSLRGASVNNTQVDPFLAGFGKY